MALTARTVAALVVAALSALLVAPAVAVALALVVVAVALGDALAARAEAPRIERTVSPVLARGVAVPLRVGAQGSRTVVRQPLVPDLSLDLQQASTNLDAQLTPRRRGRHVLPGVATRTRGPLGLGAWQRRAATAPVELAVYPDLPAARRLALAVREGRYRDAGLRARGPIGLGTEFERVRDYLPDDDIRQVNWRATARLGRPMSNQHRVEQDQEIVIVLDIGRLMAAPLGDRTRLDTALDAATALALVADELGDRIGAVAFDDAIRRRIRPGRASGSDVIRATFDLEPSERDSDYELAFRTVGGGKRALVVVLTDLLDTAAARALTDAVPVLTRRHAVLIASTRDPDVEALAAPESDPYMSAAARALLEARTAAVAAVTGAGAQVVEANPDRLSAACVRAYLRAKSRGRL